jgi:N-acetylmuramoyl-L-alanine amidase
MIFSSLNNYSYAGDYVKGFYIQYDNQTHKYNSKIVTLIIDGKELKTGDMPAIIIGDRTLVPVREVCETVSVGAVVQWDNEKKEVYISNEDKYIVLKINSKTAYVNGKPIELDVPAKIVRDVNKKYGKTMVPIRFVSEQLGFDVKWDNKTSSAILSSQEYLGDNNEDVEENNNEQENNSELPTPLANEPIIWNADEQVIDDLKSSYVENTIIDQNNPDVILTSIKYVDDTTNQFVISANGPISSATYTNWDGKFIVDVKNAIWDMKSTEAFDDNPIATGVRSSQYSEEPMVTRIVFDLKNSSYKLELALSEDRKQLIVKALSNSIYGIQLGQNEKGDFIILTGLAAPNVDAFRLSSSNRIVFDIPNTKTVLKYNEAEAEGQYITGIRSSQFNDTTTRVVVDVNRDPDFSISKFNDNSSIIQFKDPTYSNIKYENKNVPTIILSKGSANINYDAIKYKDNYLNKEYSITLPGDFTSVFGSGDLKINDNIIQSISIGKDNNGNTRLLIKENGIYEFKLVEEKDNIVIKVYEPKQLHSKVIVVDAGHGGKDPGAIANGMKEKTLNLNIVKYLKEYLDKDDSIKVYYTRLDDSYPTLQDRCDLANEVDADFFLSVHNNAFYSIHNGTESLYFPTRKPNALDSYELADIFQKKIVAATGMKNRGLKSRENLYVLKHTTMPAIIVEIGFMTNSNDAAKLKKTSFQKTAAKSLYDGIKETFIKYPTGR